MVKKMVKTVLTSGAFDLLHYGHIHLLEEAKKLGGPDSRLVVIVARDETINKLKGKPPVIPEDQRRAVIEALKVVDEALLGYEDINMSKVINLIKPDIIAVGYDQQNIENMTNIIIEKQKLSIKVIKLGKFGKSELNSSSKIKRKIVEDWQ